MKKQKKILVISVAGIGSTLLTLPMLKAIKHHFQGYRVDLLCGQKPSLDLLKDEPYIDNLLLFNRKIFRNFFSNIKHLFMIIKTHYDYAFLAFPANRAEFNLLSFLTFARHRISHKYPNKKILSLSFLNTFTVPLQPVHDTYNNILLLKALGIKEDELCKIDKSIKINVTSSDIEKAQQILNTNKIDVNKFICIHPGCSKDQPYKRWPLNKYARLIDKITLNHGHHVIIFTGYDEKDSFNVIYSNLSDKAKGKVAHFHNLNPKTIAALAMLSVLFISNDSGLMHLAVASGAKVLAVYGASDPRRTAPYHDMNNVIVSGLSCQPCNRTFHNLGEKFKCSRIDYFRRYSEYECLDRLKVDKVYDKVKLKLF